MPFINDDPKVKIPIYKVTKQYVSNYIISSVDCYSFLPDCGDVKNNDSIGVRLMCVTEPILVGHFITRRTYHLSEFRGRMTISFITGSFAEHLTVEELFKERNKGVFKWKKQIKK